MSLLLRGLPHREARLNRDIIPDIALKIKQTYVPYYR
jgi:hypothetical protein